MWVACLACLCLCVGVVTAQYTCSTADYISSFPNTQTELVYTPGYGSNARGSCTGSSLTSDGRWYYFCRASTTSTISVTASTCNSYSSGQGWNSVIYVYRDVYPVTSGYCVGQGMNCQYSNDNCYAYSSSLSSLTFSAYPGYCYSIWVGSSTGSLPSGFQVTFTTSGTSPSSSPDPLPSYYYYSGSASRSLSTGALIGAIVGGVVGFVVLLIALILVCVCCCKKSAPTIITTTTTTTANDFDPAMGAVPMAVVSGPPPAPYYPSYPSPPPGAYPPPPPGAFPPPPAYPPPTPGAYPPPYPPPAPGAYPPQPPPPAYSPTAYPPPAGAGAAYPGYGYPAPPPESNPPPYAPGYVPPPPPATVPQ